MKQFRYIISVLAFILMCTTTYAQDYDIFLTLNGFEAGTGSPGVGDEPGPGGYSGCYYDSTTHELIVNFVFYGLSGTTTLADIHGPAPMFVTAGPIIPFLTFPLGVTFGSFIDTFTLSPIHEAYLFDSKLYVDIHTTAPFVGGVEIRGQLHPVGPFPVELISFNAVAKGRGVELAWKTATEVNNHGFEIERKAIENGKLTIDNWTKIGFVEGHGTTNAPQSYSFVDANATGTVSYRLKQIDRDGQFEYSQEVEVMISQMPQMFTLMQNYPNPFNPSTAITYSVPNTGRVSLSVYDMLGKEVASLVNGVIESGEHSVRFNASNLAAGVYFYTLRVRQTAKNPAVKTEGGQAGDLSATKKLSLIK